MEDSKMQLLDWLDDLCVRFIINLPQEELESVERICFQVEEAQWFYEDFIRPLNPQLPSLSLRDFCLRIFQHCPLFAQFSQENHLAAFSEFLAYKTRVPVRGVIMLNEEMDQVLLVKGWKKSASWSFPRGKINKDEPDLDCAVREAYEETGFDLQAAGLVEDESKMKFIEVTMREQHIKLYVFRGVPTDTQFAPRTRKEISKIEWWKLASLPGYRKKKNGNLNQVVSNGEVLSANKLYIVAPFLVPLKRWIAEQKRADSQRYSGGGYDSVASGYEVIPDDPVAPVEPPRLDGAATMRSGGDYNAHIPMNQLHAQAPFHDTAAELKRMLSMGSTAPDVAHSHSPQATGNAGNLLALFKSSAGAPPSSFQSAGPIANDMQYSAPVSQQWPGAVPQPSPGFHAAQQQQQQQQQQNASQFGQVSHLQRLQPSGMPGLQRPGLSTPAQVHHSVSGFPSTPQGYQQASQTSVPAFYQHASYPAPMQEAVVESAPKSIAPHASQLPAPKLSANAENLLNMFRSKPAPDAPETAPIQAPNQHAQNLLNAFKSKPAPPLPSPPANAWNQPLTSQKRGSLGGLVPASIPPPRKGSAASVQATKPTPPPPGSIGRPSPVAAQPSWTSLTDANKPLEAPSDSKPTSHKDALLSLFKSPVTSPQQARLTTAHAISHDGLPAELSAVASPNPIPSLPRAPQPIQAKTDNHQPKVFSILQRPQQEQTPPVQSAQPPAASQQSKTPTFVQPKSPATIVRRNRHDPSSPKGGRNSPLPRQQTPIQILKRPADASKPDVSPTASAPLVTASNGQQQRTSSSRPASRHSKTASIGKATSKQHEKPVFQPQILKRPTPSDQQSPKSGAPIPSPEPLPLPSRSPLSLDQSSTVPTPAASASPPAPAPAPAPAQAADTAQAQRQKLLSLFHPPPPQTQTLPQRNGSTSTPRSPSVASGLATTVSTYSPGTYAVAGPSSVSPLPGSHVKPMTRNNSLAAPSTPQTPISPSDRGFLLGYLESVVKGAGAGK